MNYELASKLKEAGFPQDMRSGSQIKMHTDGGNVVYVPTLLELIIWCGPQFRHLSRYEEHESEVWKASGIEDGMNVVCQGKTPEVAVALLGLTLIKTQIVGESRLPYVH